ncbi:hypothetical protein KC322_g23 [Hortaea werneckii]|nr:hypothetical protein KC322_g23 [Hortaea werneckii]
MLLLLGLLELLRRRPHLVSSVVDEPQRTNGRDGKGDTVSPLDRDLADNLVKELTPSLHKEGRSDFAATVQTVLASRNLASANSILHARGGGHRIFTTDSDAAETEASAEPIADNADKDLTNDDTNDFQILDGLRPGLVASGVVFPAVSESSRKQRLDTSTGNDHVTEVEADWAERIGFHHLANGLKLSLGLGIVDFTDESRALANGHVSPVSAIFVVAVIRKEQRAEDSAFGLVHVTNVGSRDMAATHVRAMGGSIAVVPHRGVSHGEGAAECLGESKKRSLRGDDPIVAAQAMFAGDDEGRNDCREGVLKSRQFCTRLDCEERNVEGLLARAFLRQHLGRSTSARAHLDWVSRERRLPSLQKSLVPSELGVRWRRNIESAELAACLCSSPKARLTRSAAVPLRGTGMARWLLAPVESENSIAHHWA